MSRPMPRGASVTASRDHVGSVHVATTLTAIPVRLTCSSRYCMLVFTDDYSCKYLRTCVTSVGKSCEMFKMPHVIGSRFSMINKHSIKECCRVMRGAFRPSLTWFIGVSSCGHCSFKLPVKHIAWSTVDSARPAPRS